MKIAFAFALFALVFVTTSNAICDPDSNGEPTCETANEGAVYRNFWDPTHYFKCEGGKAVTVRCPSQTGFLAAEGECVPWKQWKWTPPCPESS